MINQTWIKLDAKQSSFSSNLTQEIKNATEADSCYFKSVKKAVRNNFTT
jgi:hypothetical protein